MGCADGGSRFSSRSLSLAPSFFLFQSGRFDGALSPPPHPPPPALLGPTPFTSAPPTPPPPPPSRSIKRPLGQPPRVRRDERETTECLRRERRGGRAKRQRRRRRPSPPPVAAAPRRPTAPDAPTLPPGTSLSTRATASDCPLLAIETKHAPHARPRPHITPQQRGERHRLFSLCVCVCVWALPLRGALARAPEGTPGAQLPALGLNCPRARARGQSGRGRGPPRMSSALGIPPPPQPHPPPRFFSGSAHPRVARGFFRTAARDWEGWAVPREAGDALPRFFARRARESEAAQRDGCEPSPRAGVGAVGGGGALLLPAAAARCCAAPAPRMQTLTLSCPTSPQTHTHNTSPTN